MEFRVIEILYDRKTCTKCGETKDLSFFYTYKRRDSTEIVKFSKCKTCCRNEERSKYNTKTHKEKRSVLKKKWALSLTDSYVKERIIQTTELKYSDIPQELIDAWREQIKLKRLIKQMSNQ